ncbi:MAG: hypothetical protein AAF412_11700 [Pseudomonadota bacterium]
MNRARIMAQLTTRFGVKLLAVLMIALAVVSCGRRGGLEAPPSATVVTIDEYGNEIEKPAEPATPEKPFILDPLL